jgi:hypothetical protein
VELFEGDKEAAQKWMNEPATARSAGKRRPRWSLLKPARTEVMRLITARGARGLFVILYRLTKAAF